MVVNIPASITTPFPFPAPRDGYPLCLNDWRHSFTLQLHHSTDHSEAAKKSRTTLFNPLNPELNPVCYLLALLAHHFLHVSRIRVKSLTLRLLMSYIYIQGDSGGICNTLGNDSMCDSKQKSSYEHGSDFERLRSYDRLNLRIEGNDYWQ